MHSTHETILRPLKLFLRRLVIPMFYTFLFVREIDILCYENGEEQRVCVLKWNKFWIEAEIKLFGTENIFSGLAILIKVTFLRSERQRLLW